MLVAASEALTAAAQPVTSGIVGRVVPDSIRETLDWLTPICSASCRPDNLAARGTRRIETFKFLIHDCDPIFTRAFNEVFEADDLKIIRTKSRT
jgi:hypothetical protein